MKYIVSYSVEKEIDKKPEFFYGFSEWYLNRNSRTRDVKLTKQFVQINLKEFNEMKFKDNDIVILPFFNRNRLNYEYEMITNQIKSIFGKNLYRKNTHLILGVCSESNGNRRRRNPDYNITNEEAGDLVYKLVGKENQKVKLIVDGSAKYGIKKPTNNKSKLVSGNLFMEWAEKLLTSQKEGGVLAHGEIFKNNIKKIKKLEDRDKLFTCLQRRPRLCRFINLYNIYRYNLDKSGFYSLRLSSFDPVRGYADTFRRNRDWKIQSENFKTATREFTKFIKTLKGRESYQCDDVDLNVNLALNLNSNHYLDSYFHVVVESLIDSEVMFFTEKIYKPIICGAPFFVLGNRGSIRELHNLGFKTFDKWWDESYDDDFSHWERSKKVFSILEELNKKSKSELNIILNEQLPILIDNYNRMKHLIKNNTYIEDIIKLIL
jgi:hypothetical protein